MIEEQLNEIKNFGKSINPTYVLNLIINNNNNLQLESGRLPFNLFYINKKNKGLGYVFSINGECSFNSSNYPTFSRDIVKNLQIAFKNIKKKQPKYLLFCRDLEGMNTLLYVKDNDIYVYRIIQKEEYLLSEYFEKFRGQRRWYMPAF